MTASNLPNCFRVAILAIILALHISFNDAAIPYPPQSVRSSVKSSTEIELIINPSTRNEGDKPITHFTVNETTLAPVWPDTRIKITSGSMSSTYATNIVDNCYDDNLNTECRTNDIESGSIRLFFEPELLLNIAITNLNPFFKRFEMKYLDTETPKWKNCPGSPFTSVNLGTSKLENRGDTPSYPLTKCQGDCDSDSHCADGLKCFERENGESIPGCHGTSSDMPSHYDVCYDSYDYSKKSSILLLNRGGTPSSYYPLTRCQGDCDNDLHCADGLKCFQRENGESIPGCHGDSSNMPPTYDVCVDYDVNNEVHFNCHTLKPARAIEIKALNGNYINFAEIRIHPRRFCSETLTGTKDSGYRGCQSRTKSGKLCQKW